MVRKRGNTAPVRACAEALLGYRTLDQCSLSFDDALPNMSVRIAHSPHPCSIIPVCVCARVCVLVTHVPSASARVRAYGRMLNAQFLS